MMWPPPEIDTLGGQALWLLRHYPGQRLTGAARSDELYEWEKSAALLCAKAESEMGREIEAGP